MKGKDFTRVIVALVFAFTATGLLLILWAFCIYKLDLNEAMIGIGTVFTYAMSCLVAGITIGRMQGEKKYIWGIIVGCLYFAIICVISLIISKNIGCFSGNLVSTFVLCVCGGMLGGMIS